MTSQTPIKGSKGTFTARFYKNDILTNPTDVSVQVRAPDESEPSYTPVNVDEEAGIWAVEVTYTMPGRWYVLFTGTGDVTATIDGHQDVDSTVFD